MFGPQSKLSISTLTLQPLLNILKSSSQQINNFKQLINTFKEQQNNINNTNTNTTFFNPNFKDILIPFIISITTTSTTIYYNSQTNTIVKIDAHQRHNDNNINCTNITNNPIFVINMISNNTQIIHNHITITQNHKGFDCINQSSQYHIDYDTLLSQLEQYKIEQNTLMDNNKTYTIKCNPVQLQFNQRFKPFPKPTPIIPHRFKNHQQHQLVQMFNLNTTSANVAAPNGTTRLDQISQIAINHDLGIIALQETRIKHIHMEQHKLQHQQFHQDYMTEIISCDLQNDKQKGMMLSIKKIYNPSFPRQLRSQHCLGATFDLYGIPTLYFNIYIHPDFPPQHVNEIITTITNGINLFQGHNVIICGDFNCNNTSSKSLIIDQLPSLVWRSTTSNNPITFTNTNNPDQENNVKRSLDHFWYTANGPHIQCNTHVNARGLNILPTQHKPLITTMALINPINTNNHHQQQMINIDETIPDEDVLAQLKKLTSTTQSIKFRRYLMSMNHTTRTHDLWNEIDAKVKRHMVEIENNKDNEYKIQVNIDAINNTILQASLAIIKQHLNSFQQFNHTTKFWSKLTKYHQKWDQWSKIKLLLSPSSNDKWSAYNLLSLSHKESYNLVMILEQMFFQNMNDIWKTFYNKQIHKGINIYNLLRSQGKYKEAESSLAALNKYISNPLREQNNTVTKALSITIDGESIDEPSLIADEFAKRLNQLNQDTNDQHKIIQDQLLHYKQQLVAIYLCPNKTEQEYINISILETKIKDLQYAPKQREENTTSLEKRFTCEEISRAALSVPRFSSVGTEFIPGELWLGLCQEMGYQPEITKNEYIEKNLSRNKQHEWLDIIPRNINKNQRFTAYTNEETLNPMLECITRFFNIIYKYSCIPSVWNVSHITFIPKDKNNNDIGNHRPISICSTLQKVLHKALNTRLQSHIKQHKILSPTQCAYLTERERHENISILMNKIYIRMKQQLPTHALYIDVSKAFDSIPHDQLIQCLEAKLPKARKFIQFVKNTYSNLHYTVKVGGFYSDIYKQLVGIKQGCNLSPLLFLLYFDEVDQGVKNCVNAETLNTTKFADDLCAYAHNEKDIKKIYNKIQINAKRLRLTLNAKKTNITIFGAKNQQISRPQSIKINDNEEINIVSEAKYLGCKLNQHLDLEQMIPMSEFTKRFEMHRKTLTNALLTLNMKSTIFNREITSKLLHDAPIIGLLLTDIPGVEKSNNKHMNEINKLFESKLKTICSNTFKKSNISSTLPHIATQIIPPSITCITQTTRIITKYANKNSTPNHVLRKLINDKISIFAAFTKRYIETPLKRVKTVELQHQTLPMTLTGPIINDPTLQAILPKAPDAKVGENYIPALLPKEIDLRPFMFHANIETPLEKETVKSYQGHDKMYAGYTSDLLFIFPTKITPFKFDPGTHIVPEVVKHITLLKKINNALSTKSLGQYIHLNIHKDHHLLIQLQNNLYKLYDGWDKLLSLRMGTFKPHQFFNKNTKRYEKILCSCMQNGHQVERTVWHCLTQCTKLKFAKQSAIAATTLILSKYKLNELHHLEVSKLPDVEERIKEIKDHFITHNILWTELIPIIDDPLSDYSQTILKWHNLRPGQFPGQYWKSTSTDWAFIRQLRKHSDMNKKYYDAHIDQYVDLSIWAKSRKLYPDIPCNIQSLDSLIQTITSNDPNNLHKFYSTDPQQIPTVIRLFCLIFMAEFLPNIIRFTRE